MALKQKKKTGRINFTPIIEFACFVHGQPLKLLVLLVVRSVFNFILFRPFLHNVPLESVFMNSLTSSYATSLWKQIVKYFGR